MATDKQLVNDPVNSPSHYTSGGIETIDVLQSKMTAEEFKGFCKGNSLKYILRAGKKEADKDIQDIEKSIWYLNKLVSIMKAK